MSEENRRRDGSSLYDCGIDGNGWIRTRRLLEGGRFHSNGWLAARQGQNNLALANTDSVTVAQAVPVGYPFAIHQGPIAAAQVYDAPYPLRIALQQSMTPGNRSIPFRK